FVRRVHLRERQVTMEKVQRDGGMIPELVPWTPVLARDVEMLRGHARPSIVGKNPFRARTSGHQISPQRVTDDFSAFRVLYVRRHTIARRADLVLARIPGTARL